MLTEEEIENWERSWQRSNTGVYHFGTSCNGRNTAFYLSGAKKTLEEIQAIKGARICKKCYLFRTGKKLE